MTYTSKSGFHSFIQLVRCLHFDNLETVCFHGSHRPLTTLQTPELASFPREVEPHGSTESFRGTVRDPPPSRGSLVVDLRPESCSLAPPPPPSLWLFLSHAMGPYNGSCSAHHYRARWGQGPEIPRVLFPGGPRGSAEVNFVLPYAF